MAIRAGSIPEEPDNVVQPLIRLRTGLYAARRYVEKYGLLPGTSVTRIPVMDTLRQNV